MELMIKAIHWIAPKYSSDRDDMSFEIQFHEGLPSHCQKEVFRNSSHYI